MNLPEDIPPPAPKPALPLGNLVDEPAPITPQQRAADFSKRFVWHDRELTFSIASEFYYRDLRTHLNAPPLHTYRTMGDFSPEAGRVLYCCSLSPEEIAALQLLPPAKQIQHLNRWVEANITFAELLEAAELANQINAAITRALTKPMENEEEEIDGMGN